MKENNIKVVSGRAALDRIVKKYGLRIESIQSREDILRDSTRNFSAPIFARGNKCSYNK